MTGAAEPIADAALLDGFERRTLPRLFYTRERMSSPEARLRFVPPDLAPLPRPPGWDPTGGA